MPLAPDRKVGRARLDAVHELAQHWRGDVPVPVDEAEVSPPAETEAEAQGVALALVHRQMDHLDLRTELFEAGVVAISGTVGHRNDLEADPAIAQERDHLRHVRDEVRPRVVIRDDHGQLELAFG